MFLCLTLSRGQSEYRHILLRGGRTNLNRQNTGSDWFEISVITFIFLSALFSAIQEKMTREFSPTTNANSACMSRPNPTQFCPEDIISGVNIFQRKFKIWVEFRKNYPRLIGKFR